MTESPSPPEVRESLTPGSPATRRLHVAGALLVALLAATSVVAAIAVDRSNQAVRRDRLRHAATRVERYAHERYGTYEHVLRGVAALFRASQHVTEADFAEYVRSLELAHRDPPMHSIAFAVEVDGEALADFERQASLEHPGYRLHPRVDVGTHYVVRYLEPEAPHAAVLGFDLASEPRRRAALEESTRTDRPSLTERIRLIQHPEAGPAFDLFVAVRDSHADGPRHGRVLGWVFTMLTAEELFAGATRLTGADVLLEVTDSETGGTPVFRAEPPDARRPREGHEVSVPLRLGVRTWRISVLPGPGFVSPAERSQPLLVLFLGLSITLATAGFIFSLLRTRARAIHLADGMTRALRESEQSLREANTRLSQLAMEDGLTGTSNRRYFDDRLREECARATRSGAALSLVMVDIDRFKSFNDHYGHPEGDECLRRLARALAASARRGGEVVARYGGEEFVLLLPGSDREQAFGRAEAARARIEALGIPHAGTEAGHVTASFGVAAWGVGPATTPEALVQAADTALYIAKSRGRNRVVVAPTADEPVPTKSVPPTA